MTDNDRRVLAGCIESPSGWAPHGLKDRIGVCRLRSAGLIEFVGLGYCDECLGPIDVDSIRREHGKADPKRDYLTELPLYKATEKGRKEHERALQTAP